MHPSSRFPQYIQELPLIMIYRVKTNRKKIVKNTLRKYGYVKFNSEQQLRILYNVPLLTWYPHHK